MRAQFTEGMEGEVKSHPMNPVSVYRDTSSVERAFRDFGRLDRLSMISAYRKRQTIALMNLVTKTTSTLEGITRALKRHQR